MGIVVEILPNDQLLVEFADDNGRAYAVTPVKNAKLLVLQYEREEASKAEVSFVDFHRSSQKGRSRVMF